jgi:uncharacterized protein
VAFELDFGKMEEIASVMMARGMNPGGRTLSEMLPAEVYADVVYRAGELGLPVQMFDGMKPWMAAMVLTALLAEQGGFEAASGIDSHFFQRAMERGLRVVGLETAEEQIDVFDRLDEAEQIAFLESTLEQFDESIAMLETLTAHWQQGEAEEVAAILLDAMQDQPALMERILYQRNRNWISQIEALMAAGEQAIVIVGMGHLTGEGSVIALLRERGYAVRQVTR